MASSINGLGTYYSDLYASNTSGSDKSTSADKLEGTLNNTNYLNATADELMGVCKEFESYFTEQVFKAMQKMVPESSSESSGGSSYMNMFGDMLTQEYASASTQQGGLGLAQMLYEQMKRNYNVED